MKKTLVAMMLMCGAAFAQYPNSAGAGAGAPGNYPPEGGYGAPSSAYPGQGQDPYSVGAGVGAPGNYLSPAQADMGCPPAAVWRGPSLWTRIRVG